MIRTQVQLTEEQLRGLRDFSAMTGKSIAELIRNGVDQLLARRCQPSQQDRVQRAIRAAGKFASGTADTSVNHDRVLAEAYKG